MKTYLEIKVPISYDAFWFSELRKALKDVPLHWQNDYYHITMAFLDDTRNLPEVEAIMRSYLDNANAVSMTFNKLDVFTTNNGMKIVHLTTDSIPDNFLQQCFIYVVPSTAGPFIRDTFNLPSAVLTEIDLMRVQHWILQHPATSSSAGPADHFLS